MCGTRRIPVATALVWTTLLEHNHSGRLPGPSSSSRYPLIARPTPKYPGRGYCTFLARVPGHYTVPWPSFRCPRLHGLEFWPIYGLVHDRIASTQFPPRLSCTKTATPRLVPASTYHPVFLPVDFRFQSSARHCAVFAMAPCCGHLKLNLVILVLICYT